MKQYCTSYVTKEVLCHCKFLNTISTIWSPLTALYLCFILLDKTSLLSLLITVIYVLQYSSVEKCLPSFLACTLALNKIILIRQCRKLHCICCNTIIYLTLISLDSFLMLVSDILEGLVNSDTILLDKQISTSFSVRFHCWNNCTLLYAMIDKILIWTSNNLRA